MHMADALVSPAVGCTMWATSAVLIGYSAKKVREDADEQKIPLMGVVGAFIFAAQMINFSIPGTGSSGHIGGGMMLAILLGPYAAFLTISSVLTVQALFFADGGLLALGCNIFNMGFFPAFLAYPFIYKPIVGSKPTKKLIVTASIVSAIVALQAGAFGVVMETSFSGIAELPFRKFILLMQPIHFAIGIGEGLATAALVMFIWKARPEIINTAFKENTFSKISIRKVMIILSILVVITGGVLSWFASSYPDGLEWSMLKTSGTEELTTPEKGIHSKLSAIQEKSVFLPDYSFKQKKSSDISEVSNEKWPNIDAGTTVSGILGSVLTLILAVLIGIILKWRTSKTKNK
ncbi:MAG: cobalamin biosynthesis protein CbiM [Planctomycetia bacterium]|nr:cobalamin biosynthesis protein CbiM [Planctomycetia bacterium]